MKLKLNQPEKEVVRALISKWFCRMFEVKQGKFYLLLDHHKYIDFRKAKRIRIGKANGEGFYYLTDTICTRVL